MHTTTTEMGCLIQGLAFQILFDRLWMKQITEHPIAGSATHIVDVDDDSG